MVVLATGSTSHAQTSKTDREDFANHFFVRGLIFLVWFDLSFASAEDGQQGQQGQQGEGVTFMMIIHFFEHSQND
jgi:hypothetical protein